MDRKQIRHKRRVRNQVISYIVVVLVLIGAGVGLFFGVSRLVGQAKEKEQQRVSESLVEEQAGKEAEELMGQQTAAVETGIPVQTEAEPTKEERLAEMVDSLVMNMTLEDKVAGLFVITPEQLTGNSKVIQAGDATLDALEKYPVGGLVYFAQNIQSADQLKQMLQNTAGYAKYPLFLGVDEEGGRVARVEDGLKLTNVGPMSEIGAAGDSAAAYKAGQTIGGYLKEYGFNVDFAPVADVLTNPDNKVIGDRSFGSDPQVVAQMTAEAVKGLQDTGISACVKHFPGHGDTAGDSHTGKVNTDRTKEEIESGEFLPFTAGIEAGVDMVMVGHISAPSLTDGDTTPACMNEKIITGILREQLGFNGIVITDAMNMGAVSEYYAADEASVNALKAGADMVMMPEDFTKAYEGVLAAVKDGTIDEQRITDSLKRIYMVKYADSLD